MEKKIEDKLNAGEWLKKEGYPDVMTMTRDNLENILNRYASQPQSQSAGVWVNGLQFPKNEREDFFMFHWRYASDKVKLDTDFFELDYSGYWTRLKKKGGTGCIGFNEIEWLDEKPQSQVSDGEIGLTFNALRNANKLRLPQFKNSKGEPAHEKADGSDWSLAEWMNAVAGELGEAANIIKKIRRGDMTLIEAKEMLAEEFADIVTYLDITAYQAGINLGEATKNKFNKVSERVGSNIRLDKAALQYSSVDGWISVEDRLPENREKVLCFNGYRMSENSYEEYTDQNKDWFKKTFTHWQPLPKQSINNQK